MGLQEEAGPEFKVFAEFGQLLDYYQAADLILVDIPIGLPECPERRSCDGEARRKLGRPRGSSVFTTPTRQTVQLSADPSVNIGKRWRRNERLPSVD